MPRCNPVFIPNPPPLWHTQLVHCRAIRRDLGAPAVLIEGRLLDGPHGPRVAATVGLPPEMGEPIGLAAHPSYRAALRDAAGMLTFARMAALAASGIDPVTASSEPEEALWQLAVLPAGVVLIARTEEADFGPFLMAEGKPDEHQLDTVALQLDFAGITVGDPPPPAAQGARA
jgi:hypothetical protein